MPFLPRFLVFPLLLFTGLVFELFLSTFGGTDQESLGDEVATVSESGDSKKKRT